MQNVTIPYDEKTLAMAKEIIKTPKPGHYGSKGTLFLGQRPQGL